MLPFVAFFLEIQMNEFPHRMMIAKGACGAASRQTKGEG
jgi:hypothetical protein